jgi:beta-xylosidase
MSLNFIYPTKIPQVDHKQLFWDDDGQTYLSSTYRMHTRTPVPAGSKLLKDFAIHICKVDLTSGHCLTTPQLIRSSSSGVAEGSHIIKRGKYYYLFTAEGGTEAGHSEYVSRSETSPFGPWEGGRMLVSSGIGADDAVQNTGHCDLVEDAGGNWWAVLLAVRPVRTSDGEWERSVFGMSQTLSPDLAADFTSRPRNLSSSSNLEGWLANLQQ